MTLSGIVIGIHRITRSNDLLYLSIAEEMEVHQRPKGGSTIGLAGCAIFCGASSIGITSYVMYPYIIKYLNLPSTRDVNLKRSGKREFTMPRERDSLSLLGWDVGNVKHWVLTFDSTRVRVFLVFV